VKCLFLIDFFFFSLSRKREKEAKREKASIKRRRYAAPLNHSYYSLPFADDSSLRPT
jgi:hypothetical protein